MLNEKILPDKYTELLYQLFVSKKWSIDGNEEISVFDRFCHRMAELEKDEDRDFILELTKNYLRIDLKEYEKLLIDVFRKVFKEQNIKLEKNERIFICPLLPESDFGKLKSSTMMLYVCQGTFLRMFSAFHKNQIRICQSLTILKEHEKAIGKLILIDDFIGSGETALGCMEYIKSLNINKDDIIIVSLVSQEEGIKLIRENDVLVYSALVRKKGITDHYPEEELEDKLKQMQRISKKFRIPPNMELGYAESEALVTMIKTPNNTFPFYWYEKNSNSYAPFPRRENVKVLS